MKLELWSYLGLCTPDLPPPFGGGLIEATMCGLGGRGGSAFRPRLGAASLKLGGRCGQQPKPPFLPPPFGGGLIEARRRRLRAAILTTVLPPPFGGGLIEAQR